MKNKTWAIVLALFLAVLLPGCGNNSAPTTDGDSAATSDKAATKAEEINFYGDHETGFIKMGSSVDGVQTELLQFKVSDVAADSCGYTDENGEGQSLGFGRGKLLKSHQTGDLYKIIRTGEQVFPSSISNLMVDKDDVYRTAGVWLQKTDASDPELSIDAAKKAYPNGVELKNDTKHPAYFYRGQKGDAAFDAGLKDYALIYKVDDSFTLLIRVSDKGDKEKDIKSAVDTYGDEAVANYLYSLIAEPSA
ncbi:hypothetical protein [Atopobium fossor]|uniref:hypothetical protein n=1 Tax=Atopobium fossor TaxID=39487 RepID=UPI00040B1B80|nr:hypothetical protein [Atopobium fossor]